MTSVIDMVALVTLGVFKIGHSGIAPSAQNNFDTALIAVTSDFLTEFGEPITYYPSGKIGDTITGSGDILSIATLGIFRQDDSGRQITAIVDRGQPTGLDGAPHGNAPLATIEVANDPTIGISSSEVDTGGDKVEVALRIGETVQQRRITEVLENQDTGMMRLEIR